MLIYQVIDAQKYWGSDGHYYSDDYYFVNKENALQKFAELKAEIPLKYPEHFKEAMASNEIIDIPTRYELFYDDQYGAFIQMFVINTED